MINVITDEQQIKKLHDRFHSRINQYFRKQIDCWVGFPSGSFQTIVRYSPNLDLWISSQELDTRFWNGFGIGKPIEARNNSLAGEINFPYAGINRRIAGAFAMEENGNILVLHRGRIGGGRPGIGKFFFTDNFRGDFVTAIDGNKETVFCLIGELNSYYLPKQIKNFISEIHRVKYLEEADSAKAFSNLSKFSYTSEHTGTTVTERNDPKVIERIHGIVVNALAAELEGKGYKTGNDRNRDLFIHTRNKILKLFEIKTSSSTQNLYSAVGQLLIYSIPILNNVELIAVLPCKLSRTVENKFSKLGIKLLYYEWDNDKPKFSKLDQIV